MTMIEELHELDQEERRLWQEGAEKGIPWEELYVSIRESTRERFLEIVRKYNDAPVYRIPYPAAHR